jgi:hypothetical protein
MQLSEKEQQKTLSDSLHKLKARLVHLRAPPGTTVCRKEDDIAFRRKVPSKLFPPDITLMEFEQVRIRTLQSIRDSEKNLCLKLREQYRPILLKEIR